MQVASCRAAASSSPACRYSVISRAWWFSSSGFIDEARAAYPIAASRSPRDTGPERRLVQDRFGGRGQSPPGGQQPGLVGRRTARTVSRRGVPRRGPAVAIASDHEPRTRISVSTSVPGGSSRTTGSPSTEPSSPSARLISASDQRRARAGSSASREQQGGQVTDSAASRLPIRYARMAQLFRLRNW